MIQLLPMLIISVVLATISERKTQTLKLNNMGSKEDEKEKKEMFFFLLLCIIMIAFIGTRRAYNDTDTYIYGYEKFTSSDFNDIFNVSWSLSNVPGFTIVNIILKSIGTTSQNFIMFYALVDIPIYIWFLRKYSSNFPLTIYLFFTMELFVFTAAAIKQVTATAIALIAIDRLINKRYLSFFVFITISCLFHPYAIVFYLAPLLFFKPWTKCTVVLVVIGVAIAFSLQNLFGVVGAITSSVGGSSSSDYYSGEGVNFFRVLVSAMPFILSFLMCRERTKNEADRKDCFIFNLALMNAVLMFIGMFGTANQFGRFANYFLVFQTLSLPWIIQKVDIQSRKIIQIIVCVCYFIYFYYAYAINSVFDNEFSRWSIFEYLGTWF